MQVSFQRVREGSREIATAISDVRSARNLTTRQQRTQEREEQADERARRRRKQIRDREADAALGKRVTVRMHESDRPKRKKTPSALYHRQVDTMLHGSWGSSDARGPDGLYSIHFGVTARGFQSTKGRRWRAREAERAALYITRETGLEDGERGWWSSIARDRNELAAFHRVLETVERHDRANANVYMTEVIALPAELSPAQRRDAVHRFCAWFAERDLPVTAALHLPDGAGDQRNFHAHLVYSTRPAARVGDYEWSFAAAKDISVNTPDGIRARRQHVVDTINAVLEEADLTKRYTALSNRDRSMAPSTAGKIGQQATWAARRLARLEAQEKQLQLSGTILELISDSLTSSTGRLHAARKLLMRKAIQADISIAGHATDANLDVKAAGRSVAAVLQKWSSGMTVSLGAAQMKVSHARVAVRNQLSAAGDAIAAGSTSFTLPAKRDLLRNRVQGRWTAITAAQDVQRKRLEDAHLQMTALAVKQMARGRSAKTIDETTPPLEPKSEREASQPAQSAMQMARQAAATAQAAMREVALAKLVRKQARVKRDASGRYSVDLAGLADPEQRALSHPAFDAEMQLHLREMFEFSAMSTDNSPSPHGGAQDATPSSQTPYPAQRAPSVETKTESAAERPQSSSMPKRGSLLSAAAALTDSVDLTSRAKPKGPRSGEDTHSLPSEIQKADRSR